MGEVSILLKNLENFYNINILKKDLEIEELKLKINDLTNENYFLKIEKSNISYNENIYINKINILKKRIIFTEKQYNNLCNDVKKGINNDKEICYLCQNTDKKKFLVKPCKCNSYLHLKCYLKLIENKSKNNLDLKKCDFCQQNDFKLF